MNHYPMADSITDGLCFDNHYIDPYDRHEPTWDEVRQERIDELDDVLRDIGAVFEPGFMTRLQAE